MALDSSQLRTGARTMLPSACVRVVDDDKAGDHADDKRVLPRPAIRLDVRLLLEEERPPREEERDALRPKCGGDAHTLQLTRPNRARRHAASSEQGEAKSQPSVNSSMQAVRAARVTDCAQREQEAAARNGAKRRERRRGARGAKRRERREKAEEARKSAARREKARNGAKGAKRRAAGA
eukprot:6172875-Pleurochrysis_carterae.AAC.3